MDDSGDGTPAVPADRLDAGGWTLAERRVEEVFALPAAAVREHTLRYEDEALRAATGGDLDHPWRLFFATRLSFDPPLAPGIGPAVLFPTVGREAGRAFADRLADAGLAGVDRGRARRMVVDTGDRAQLVKYTATLARDAGEGDDGVGVGDGDGNGWRVPVEAWLAVWLHDGGFRLAGGAYPAGGVADLPVDDGPPSGGPWREELLDLVRAVR